MRSSETVPSAVTSSDKLLYLDSVRGLASMAVVLCHCWYLLPTEMEQNANHGFLSAAHSMSGFVFYLLSKTQEAGRSSVMMFFVLSGFVLARAAIKRPIDYRGYVIKRWFRIYPTFFVVISFSVLIHLMLGPGDVTSSQYLTEISQVPVSMSVIFQHLALLGTPAARGLDSVIWSLVHELRISIIFPILFWSLRKSSSLAGFFFLAVSFFSAIFIRSATGVVPEGFEEPTYLLSLVETSFFVIFFVAGSTLALKFESVSSRITVYPIWVKFLLIVATGYCLLKSDYAHDTLLALSNDYVRGVGSVLCLVLIFGSRILQRFLNYGFFAWLGKISYSLYLIHVPVLYLVSRTIGQHWGPFQHFDYVHSDFDLCSRSSCADGRISFD